MIATKTQRHEALNLTVIHNSCLGDFVAILSEY